MAERAEGLEGVVVADSALTKIFGDEGRLVYRGIDIFDLAEHSSFEETAKFLWDGELPNEKELSIFSSELARRRHLDDRVHEIIRNVPDTSKPMDVLRTAVSALGAVKAPDMDTRSEEGQRDIALDLVASIPTIIATCERLRNGQDPVEPREDLSHAANFLYMLNADEPEEFEEEVMDTALILHADHGFNASTFSARVTSATLADFYAAITTAIGTLSGPLHGGANQEVLKMLKDIEDPDHVEKYLQEKFESGEVVMGFGHRVYNTYDPRAKILKEFSRELSRRSGDSTFFDISRKIEEIMREEKEIDPNVDFYSASTYHSLGISGDLFTPIFAASRSVGWTANLFEQMDDNRLIRPLCNYTGPNSREYIPIQNR